MPGLHKKVINMKGKRKILAILLISLALFSVALTAGCVQQSGQTTIKSEQQVGEAVTNISENVQDVSTILNDIDSKLG